MQIKTAAEIKAEMIKVIENQIEYPHKPDGDEWILRMKEKKLRQVIEFVESFSDD